MTIKSLIINQIKIKKTKKDSIKSAEVVQNEETIQNEETVQNKETVQNEETTQEDGFGIPANWL